VPTNVLVNWSDEFRHWLPADAAGPAGLTAASVFSAEGGALAGAAIRRWHATPGACLVITHGMFKTTVLAADDEATAPLKAELSRMLTHVADVVAVDEGHVLKSPSTQLAAAMARVQTRRRLVLTGAAAHWVSTFHYGEMSLAPPGLAASA
jgi:SNF2 family DNA or RNA helicase